MFKIFKSGSFQLRYWNSRYISTLSIRSPSKVINEIRISQLNSIQEKNYNHSECELFVHTICKNVEESIAQQIFIKEEELQKKRVLLKKLKLIKVEIEEVSDKAGNLILKLGFLAMFTHLSGFSAFIFGISSWDVMEPVTYMADVFYAIIGMTYFLKEKGDFDLDSVKSHFSMKKFLKCCDHRNYNDNQVKSLEREIKAIEDFISTLKDQSSIE